VIAFSVSRLFFILSSTATSFPLLITFYRTANPNHALPAHLLFVEVTILAHLEVALVEATVVAADTVVTHLQVVDVRSS